MSHKDNMDLRNTGDGGWFYAENELFSVFAPLIGSDGVTVYMAMCRLIPLAAVDPDRTVTVRSVSEASCVSRSTTDRKMNEIVRLGMVIETRYSNRRASTYKLVSLRSLALVGIDELNRRLRVPPGDTDQHGKQVTTVLERVSITPQSPTLRDDLEGAKAAEDLAEGASSTRHSKSGVPPGDTNAYLRKTTLAELVVSQKQASVSQNRGSVSQQKGHGLIKEEEEEEELNTPIAPKGALVPSIAASVDVLEETPPVEALPRDLETAVAKVARECGLSNPRMLAVIRRALELHAGQTDEPAVWNPLAERAIRNYQTFLEDLDLMTVKYGARKFFDDGLVFDQRKWPYDKKLLDERRRL